MNLNHQTLSVVYLILGNQFWTLEYDISAGLCFVAAIFHIVLACIPPVKKSKRECEEDLSEMDKAIAEYVRLRTTYWEAGIMSLKPKKSEHIEKALKALDDSFLEFLKNISD